MEEKKKQKKSNEAKKTKNKRFLPAPKIGSTHSKYLGKFETAVLGFTFASESTVGLGPHPDYEN